MRGRPGRPREGARPAFLRWALGAACLSLVLSGCAAGPAAQPAQQAGRSSFEQTFQSASGLLFPPELWAAPSRSIRAEILRRQALDAVGQTPAPSPSQTPRAAFAALQQETGPAEAAYLVVVDGQADSAAATPPWTDREPARWFTAAAAADSVDEMWFASEVARATDARIVPTSQQLDGLARAAAGSDLVPARLATEMLGRYQPARSVAAPTGKNLRFPRDAAQLLLWDVDTRELTDGDRQFARSQAAAGVAEDDWVYALLVRAGAAAGDLGAARQQAAAFDSRRLLPDGEVLEPIKLEASIGSTFRMVRYLAETGQLETALSGAGRQRLIAAARTQLTADPASRLAALATLGIVAPDEAATTDRAAAVDAVLAAEVKGDGRLNLEQAMAWSAVAEYAQALGMTLDFPGLADDAAEGWMEQPAATSAASLARFVLVAGSTGHDDVVDALARPLDRVRRWLEKADLSEVDSTTVLASVLALYHATGDWGIDPDRVLAEIARRENGCRGGFDGFVRDLPQALAPCNVEATRFARQIRSALA